MYEVRRAGVKGLGLFAKSAIPKGTRILTERPTLCIRKDQDSGDVYTMFRLLSTTEQAKILQLSSHVPSRALRWTHVLWYTARTLVSDLSAKLRGHGTFFIPSLRSIREHKSVLSIFRTNSFAVGSTGGSSTIQQAIFARVARLNHSCIPSCQGNFDESSQHFNVHATRDIKADEELNISYLPEHGATQASRQSALAPAYGFTCACPACDLSTSRGSEGEARRLQMQKEIAAFAENVNKAKSTTEIELQIIQKYIRLFEDEGLAGRELSTMYIEAARIHERIGAFANALKYAEKGIQLDRDCLGADHPLYQQGLKYVEDLKHNI